MGLQSREGSKLSSTVVAGIMAGKADLRSGRDREPALWLSAVTTQIAMEHILAVVRALEAAFR